MTELEQMLLLAKYADALVHYHQDAEKQKQWDTVLVRRGKECADLAKQLQEEGITVVIP